MCAPSPSPAWEDFLSLSPELRSPLQLLRELRRQCALAQAQGIDWQAPPLSS